MQKFQDFGDCHKDVLYLQDVLIFYNDNFSGYFAIMFANLP